MKLLNCLKCHDVLRFRLEWRRCECGASAGRYLEDGEWAEHVGPSRIIGLLNSEYRESLTAPVVPYVTNYKWFPIKNGEHVTLMADCNAPAPQPQ